MPTYSFLDTLCAIEGPGGNINLSDDAVADEGITIEMIDDKSTMTTGAGRGGMHSQHANNAGRVRIRLLKTGKNNAKLNAMYRFQNVATGAVSGQNTITVSSPRVGDDHTCLECAFQKHPDSNYGKDGGMNEWVFNSTDITSILGTY